MAEELKREVQGLDGKGSFTNGLLPGPGFSFTIHCRLRNVPGMLGLLATTIGDARGDLREIKMLEVGPGWIERQLTVNAADSDHVKFIIVRVASIDGVEILESLDRTFELHLGGKISLVSKSSLRTKDDLSMAYTPGVARVSKAIAEKPELVRTFTIKRNCVAVVSDGSAILGLGNLGPEAALPVMEGKAMLFKEFGGVDAFPICLSTQDPDEIVETVERIAPAFGGINLEDISAPRCFEIEERLIEALDIPVFHDDQHGTAVVVLAALYNALEIVGKKISDIKIVIAGAGAAGVACAKMLDGCGVPNLIVIDRSGVIHRGRDGLNGSGKQWCAEHTNPEQIRGSLSAAIAGADVFLGVSSPGILKREDIEQMEKDSIVFPLSNPDPEIRPEEIEGVAAVVATGRSDYPNQINNVLCFPGLFRGLLDSGARRITHEMKLAAARALADIIPSKNLSPDFIVPSVFDPGVAPAVASAVSKTARTAQEH